MHIRQKDLVGSGKLVEEKFGLRESLESIKDFFQGILTPDYQDGEQTLSEKDEALKLIEAKMLKCLLSKCFSSI